jgi:hypothetical protein
MSVLLGNQHFGLQAELISDVDKVLRLLANLFRLLAKLFSARAKLLRLLAKLLSDVANLLRLLANLLRLLANHLIEQSKWLGVEARMLCERSLDGADSKRRASRARSWKLARYDFRTLPRAGYGG